MMSKNYGSRSVADLKGELRRRRAKVTGKKAVLVQRLQDYDKLFGPLVTDPESVYKIVVPEPQHFRDITSNSTIPAVNAEDLESFCRLTDRDDVLRAHNMYDEYFLMSCRVAVEDHEYYFTGMVYSEMRKNIIYNVIVKAKNHLILESQCECAAGEGPYSQCKHVMVLILGIIEMDQHKTIKLKSSVTSHLQTFHQPNKLHTGDPIMAEELTLKFKDKNYKRMATFDPRPTAELAETYQDFFKRMVVNFCGHNHSTVSIPIAQLMKPADKTSIYIDHDYLNKTKEQEFLESLELTEEGRCNLEKNTRNNKKLWKRERLMRIHSSNYGRICKYKNSKQKLAISLVKNLDIVTAAIRHGLKYEAAAVRKFESYTQLSTTKCGIFVHKYSQFLASTPDRLVEKNGVLEVKCPYTAMNQTISPENIPYLYLCENTGLLKLQESHDYYYQVQGQMMCTERQVAYFCVYTISDMKIIIIERNEDFMKSMTEKLKVFYVEHFRNALLNKFLYNKK